jgi:hypothetical protein
MKALFLLIITSGILVFFPEKSGAQVAPALGSTASFAMFTAVGAFDNVGPTKIKGDIGTNAGAFSGFPLGVVEGEIHVADTRATQAATDVQAAFAYMSSIPCVVPLAVYGGPVNNPQVLTPNAYCVGAATTLAGNLILDAQGDPNALFFLRVSGALTTAENSTVTLLNGASASNVYWQVTGRVDLGHNSVFRGTLLVDGAINLVEGASLVGRGLSRSGAITLDTNTIAVPTPTTSYWLGSRTTDWFTATNWSAGVPTSSLDAVVPNNTSPYPLLTSGSAIAKSLTIGSGASLTQQGGTLDVKGNVANTGTISATAGGVLLSGSTGQTIGGSGSTQLWDLTITNGIGATQAGAMSIHGTLALTNGNLGTNNQSLTLLSDASGTALVNNAGGVVNGTATVQRYITPDLNPGLGYRHFAAPVTNTAVADLATSSFSPLVNAGYNSSATPNTITPFPTVFGYDEGRQTSSPATTYPAFDKGWFSPAALSDALLAGQGYTVNLAAGQTVDFVGTLGNGNVSMNLTRGSGPDAGWNLLGNPYPSTLDWTKVQLPQGVDDALYVYQSTSQYGGAYRSFVNGVGTTSTIALGQGFFVRLSEGTSAAQLTLTNSARTTDRSSNAVFQGDGVELRPRLQLTLQAASGPLSDATYVYFEEGSTAGVEAHYDAVKLPNPNGLNLASRAAGRDLAINGLTMLDATPLLVPLDVAVPQVGSYALQVGELRNFSQGTSLYLHDQELGTSTLLTASTRYAFTLSSASAPNRFTLEFRPNSTLATTPAPQPVVEHLQVYPNPVQGRFTLQLPTGSGDATLTLTNALGQVVRRQAVTGEQATVEVPSLSAGVYVLRVQTATTTLRQRLVLH